MTVLRFEVALADEDAAGAVVRLAVTSREPTADQLAVLAASFTDMVPNLAALFTAMTEEGEEA